MGNVNAAGIWTPGEGDSLDPEVWSAAMAKSIEEGIGGRLDKQEQQCGLKATLAEVFDFTGDFNTVPVTIAKPSDFVTDVDFEGGIAGITVSGLYTISVSITTDFLPDVPVDMTLCVNGVFEDYLSLNTSVTSYVTGPITTSMRLTAGDSVWIAVGVGNERTETVRLTFAKLNLALIYAT